MRHAIMKLGNAPGVRRAFASALLGLLGGTFAADAAGFPTNLVPSIDPYPARLVATLSPASGIFNVSFGDMDHDGHNEVLMSWRNETNQCCYYRIYEHKGSNVYSLEYTGPFLQALAADDLDQDGLAEVIGQDGDLIRIYESVDANSFPTQLVWSGSVFSTNGARVTIGDSDRDGRRELFVANSSTLRIFECTGDNTYQRFDIPTGAGGGIGDVRVADFDQDGYVEVALTKSTGSLLKIYESPANDTWIEELTIATVQEANQMDGGYDVDGNGRPELLVAGQRWKGDTLYHRVVVYEAIGVDTLVEVASFEVTSGSTGSTTTALGDFDGDGIDEFALESSRDVWIFEPQAVADWSLVGNIVGSSGQGSIFAFDLNENGRSELIWATSLSTLQTLILEYTSGVADAFVPGAGAGGLSVAPNPFHGEASIRLSPAARGATTALVFDARGRLVHRQPFVPNAAGRGLLRVQHLQAGVYFVQVEAADRTLLARGRAVVAPR